MALGGGFPQGGGLTQPPAIPIVQAGRFYSIGDFLGVNSSQGNAVPADVIKDRIFSRAFRLTREITLASLSVLTYTGTLPATAKCLQAIYSDNNGQPGTKLLTAGELTLAVQNTTYTAAVSLRMLPGIYWHALTLSDGQPEGVRLLCESAIGSPAQALALPLGSGTATLDVQRYHTVATRVYDSTIPSAHPAVTYPTAHMLPLVLFGV